MRESTSSCPTHAPPRKARAHRQAHHATSHAEKALPALSDREKRLAIGLDWPTVIWLSILHIGALAAPFFFSWQGLVLAFVLHWLTGSIGICLTYHRLLTHSSFQTYRPVRWLLSAI